jgi:ATP-dependent Clp protease ATP-binding subunit ClpC
VGAEFINRSSALGFAADSNAAKVKENDRLLAVAKKFFKPEFLNRLDDVVVFRKLERNYLLEVIKLEVSAVVERLKSKDITLKITNEVLDFLLDKGYEPEYGARPLRRAVERYLEDPLADELLKGALPKSSKITVAITENALRFQAQAAKAPARRRKKSSE